MEILIQDKSYSFLQDPILEFVILWFSIKKLNKEQQWFCYFQVKSRMEQICFNPKYKQVSGDEWTLLCTSPTCCVRFILDMPILGSNPWPSALIANTLTEVMIFLGKIYNRTKFLFGYIQFENKIFWQILVCFLVLFILNILPS